MIIEGRDGALERQVLIASITNTAFLNRIVAHVGKTPYRSSDANLVWSLVTKYQSKYNKAPNRQMESLLRVWSRAADKDAVARIDRLLTGLSEECSRSEEQHVDFLLDLAQQHFNTVLLERHQEELRQALERGQGEAALKSITSFVPVNLRVPPSVNLLKDLAAHQQALEERQNVLVKYKGPAGEFFGNELAEDSFVAFMAPAKGSKSFLLLDIAWRAIHQGRRVAYFQIGDLTLGQILRRFQKRALYRPLEAGSFRLPIGIIAPTGLDVAQIEYEDKHYEQETSWEDAEKALKKLLRKVKGDLEIFRFPTKSVSVLDIKNVLEAKEQSGWSAEVIVIDYAGNLAPVHSHVDTVEQVSHTWALMRQLSETRKRLVVTAQQSNKEGFRAWVLTRNNFAESKMILAHVTAFLGINRTEEERRHGIIRLNFVVRREEQFVESDCLYCGAALAVANPIVCSALKEQR